MRRYDDTMNFNKNWNEYKFGFGDPRLQFWMGNEALYALTNQGNYSMLVDMLSCNGRYYYVKWNLFRIKNETMKYAVDAITVESYNTTTSIVGRIRGRAFGTADNINVYSPKSGKTCAEHHGGGWWFQTCTEFHLTGNYPNCANISSNNDENQRKMKCMAISGFNCNIGCLLQAATMKLRRNN
ncbi:fibrinogen-like protein A [Lingula anatina]|uniref:Fibrinogen-like protein A n=1 Tax=Lingula anatina TaxID=7574 RepID=A0A1S3I8I9_LINAN|nr:fibrinogen-like protein A [Lingula anatina]|eukprot:XP_013394181.1 fibrinogen-like protein A [Lingula anatina]